MRSRERGSFSRIKFWDNMLCGHVVAGRRQAGKRAAVCCGCVYKAAMMQFTLNRASDPTKAMPMSCALDYLDYSGDGRHVAIGRSFLYHFGRFH